MIWYFVGILTTAWLVQASFIPPKCPTTAVLTQLEHECLQEYGNKRMIQRCALQKCILDKIKVLNFNGLPDPEKIEEFMANNVGSFNRRQLARSRSCLNDKFRSLYSMRSKRSAQSQDQQNPPKDPKLNFESQRYRRSADGPPKDQQGERARRQAPNKPKLPKFEEHDKVRRQAQDPPKDPPKFEENRRVRRQAQDKPKDPSKFEESSERERRSAQEDSPKDKPQMETRSKRQAPQDVGKSYADAAINAGQQAESMGENGAGQLSNAAAGGMSTGMGMGKRTMGRKRRSSSEDPPKDPPKQRKRRSAQMNPGKMTEGFASGMKVPADMADAQVGVFTNAGRTLVDAGKQVIDGAAEMGSQGMAGRRRRSMWEKNVVEFERFDESEDDGMLENSRGFEFSDQLCLVHEATLNCLGYNDDCKTY